MNTTKRLLAVHAIRRRMLDQYRALPHVDRDVEHEQAVSRACGQLERMVEHVAERPYVSGIQVRS